VRVSGARGLASRPTKDRLQLGHSGTVVPASLGRSRLPRKTRRSSGKFDKVPNITMITAQNAMMLKIPWTSRRLWLVAVRTARQESR
jgi:hypothetical protein